MTAPGELWVVARALGELVEEVVFVGGMIRQLLVTDPAAGPPRPTKDVDCIVNTGSLIDYYAFSDRLHQKGFSECMDEGAPLCRWVVNDVPVDVMPVDPAILGFSNVWYLSGIDHATRTRAPEGSIKIVDAVHFCATKIESFLGRAGGDFYHYDMEDLIAVIDGRAELPSEIEAAPEEVREFIAGVVAEWLADRAFLAALPGNLAGDAASQARLPIVLARLRQIAALLVPKPKARIAAAPPAPDWSTPTLGPNLRGGPAPSLPTRVALSSSNLRAAEYDPGSQTLVIDFHRGRRYAYSGVPVNVYAGLLRAPSHGRYFHQWIRGRYSYRRLA